MSRLLSADFSRLWKNKIFWGLELVVFLCGVCVYLLAWGNVQRMGMEWLLKNAEFYFFYLMLYGMGILPAIFSSYYIGAEYSDGALRNKLCAGHCRRDIYFSNWIVIVVVSGIFLFTHFLTAVIVGIPTAGVEVITAVKDILPRMGECILILVAYTSLFTMTSMLDANKARGVAVNLLLAFGILLAGILVYLLLAQPEYTSRMLMQADGTYMRENGILNPNYLRGTKRILFQLAAAFLPSVQALHVTEGMLSISGMAAMLVVTLLFMAAGLYFFQKKDIK